MVLVIEQLVDGWEDLCMLILQGLCCCGYILVVMCLFVECVGISKQNLLIDFSVLEGVLCEDLDSVVLCCMVVVDLVKLVLINLLEGYEELLIFSNYLKDESFGSCEVLFVCELWIDCEDFVEVLLKGWKCLVLGGEVCLCGVGIICCDEVIKDVDGIIIELCGWFDLELCLGMEGVNCKVKGIIYWVSVVYGVLVEICLYDCLFLVLNLDDELEGKIYCDYFNLELCCIVIGYVELVVVSVVLEQLFQFECIGYFVVDCCDYIEVKLVFNCSVILCDIWLV